MNEQKLLKKLRRAFKMEAEERLANLSSSLLELENTSASDKQDAVLETVFREAHSLKGAARAVNLMEIETLCQSIEGVFADLKKNAVSVSPKLFDALHHSVQAIENFMIDESPHNKKDIEGLVHKIEGLKHDSVIESENPEVEEEPEVEKENSKFENGNLISESEESEFENECRTEIAELTEIEETSLDKEKSASLPVNDLNLISCIQSKPLISESIRISTSKLDSLLLEAEELASLKLIWGQRVLNLREMVDAYEHWKKKWVRAEPEYRALRNLMSAQNTKSGTDSSEGILYEDTAPALNPLSAFEPSLNALTAFLDWNQKHIRSLGREIRQLTKAAEQDHRILSRMVDDLLDDMKKVMMLPFSTLFGIFPIMVRDISRDQGKEAELVLEGGDIEIDRRILEEMKDPLTHLLRNAIDHGLEDTDTRIKRQKPRRGSIKLAVCQTESNKVEILLSDDGGGIDIARIKEKAVKSGIISEKKAEDIDDQEALSLIFRSGISSSKIITELSGRGLGLAIVQEKVEKLGGLLYIETEFGRGSSFRIQLPVTLATFRGVLVQVAEDMFIVPAPHVDCVLKIRSEEVKSVENRATISLGGDVLPLADIADILELKGSDSKPDSDGRAKTQNSNFLMIIVLGTGQKRIAFRVDKILDEQEVLVKSLGKQLRRVPNVSGATILGTGKVVPILNVHDLLKSPLQNSFRPIEKRMVKAEVAEAAEPKKHSILIAEDSITSRMLIKNILEAAGYSVKTAVDGQAAYTILKTEPFDAVVSDVEMPRMSGFELTANIRSNKKIAETPVVLVTSLDSREDRERGIDVGANAYIVKSSFDQSNLLEVISRLI